MRAAWIVLVILVVSTPLTVAQSEQAFDRATVKMWIPAVGQREDGTLFGVASSMEVTMHSPGTGQVFLSSRPLTQIDMQGSARLAVDTAAAITGQDASKSDFLFKVETPSITIGGPSAGGAMAVAVVALLQGWNVSEEVVMTGMINPDGSIGPIGGVLQKLEAADSVGAERFLVPLGQSTVAVTYQEQDPETGLVTEREGTVDVREVGAEEYGIEVEEVADLYDAVAPFTGFRLVRPEPTTDPVAGERYGGITSRLAQNLTTQVGQRLSTIQERYEAVQSDVSAADRGTIEDQLALASARFVSSREAQNESKQYLASSLAFQGLVALEHVEALVAFFESEETIESYTATYLSVSDASIEDVAEDILIEYPIPTAQLDSQAGAEQRVLEARELQAQATQAAQTQNFGPALQSSSFARQRAESARWWWSIGVEVASTVPEPALSEAALQEMFNAYHETAQLEVAYASLIAAEEPAFAAAQQAYERSLIAAQEGMFAGGLLELVQALAQTNTALVALAGDEPVRQRLDDMAARAAYQIELAEAQGSPPVYAIALLELANSRAADDPQGAFAGYSTARLMARASLQAAGVDAPPPRIEAVRQGSSFDLNDLFSPGWLAFVLLMGVGSIVLLIAWGAAARRQPVQPMTGQAREPTKTSIPFPDDPDEVSPAPSRAWLPVDAETQSPGPESAAGEAVEVAEEVVEPIAGPLPQDALPAGPATPIAEKPIVASEDAARPAPKKRKPATSTARRKTPPKPRPRKPGP